MNVVKGRLVDVSLAQFCRDNSLDIRVKNSFVYLDLDIVKPLLMGK